MLLAIFILSLSFISSQSVYSPWLMYHGNQQHDGLSPYDTSHVDGTLKWTFETDSSIESSPAIGPDGTIYIGNHANILYAVNSDGTEKWRFKVGKPEYGSEFAVW